MTVGSKSTHAECKQMLLTDSPSQMSLWAGHLCASSIFINAILRAALHSRFKRHLSDLLPWPLGHFSLQIPLQVLHPFVAMFSQWCIFKIYSVQALRQREVLQARFLTSHLPFCSLNATTWWTDTVNAHYQSLLFWPVLFVLKQTLQQMTLSPTRAMQTYFLLGFLSGNQGENTQDRAHVRCI